LALLCQKRVLLCSDDSVQPDLLLLHTVPIVARIWYIDFLPTHSV